MPSTVNATCLTSRPHWRQHWEMSTRSKQRADIVINVEHVPAPVARALAAMAETLQQQFRPKVARRPRVQLPVRSGTVIGSIRRADLYEEVI